jgi:hypothetical protein
MKSSWKDIIGREKIISKDFEHRHDVIQWDVQKITAEQLIKLTFLSKNSPYRQGVRIAIDAGKGEIEINDIKAKRIELWYDTAPQEVILKCKSSEGLLSIYNIFDTGWGRKSQMYKSGMLIEEQGNKIIYRCNDFGETDRFDKLVFSISKI